MKNYCLFLCFALFLTACSKNKQLDEEKAQKVIKEYIKNMITDADTYESIAFNKIDSVLVEDSYVYKAALDSRERLTSSISSLQERIYSLEQSGVQKTNRLYTELKDRMEEEEKKLQKVDEKMAEFEKNEKDYLYSIQHRYKARKRSNGAIMAYDEVFYIDKNHNIIEDVSYYY